MLPTAHRRVRDFRVVKLSILFANKFITHIITIDLDLEQRSNISKSSKLNSSQFNINK